MRERRMGKLSPLHVKNAKPGMDQQGRNGTKSKATHWLHIGLRQSERLASDGSAHEGCRNAAKGH